MGGEEIPIGKEGALKSPSKEEGMVAASLNFCGRLGAVVGEEP